MATLSVVAATPSAAATPATLTVRSNTWDSIGLDSNKASTSPFDTFPAGVEVCNTGETASSPVTATFNFTGIANTNIRLASDATTGGTVTSATQQIGALAGGACTQAQFLVKVQKAVFQNTQKWRTNDRARSYTITAAAATGGSASTGTRTLYAEQIVSQNRNSVLGISSSACSTTTCTFQKGHTYTVNLYAKSSPGGYDQTQAFLTFPEAAFQITSIKTAWSAPSGATANGVYGDGCGWSANNGGASGGAAECVGPYLYRGGKVGGNPIKVTYRVKVRDDATTIAAGNLQALIYDLSGGSFHYNADTGTSGKGKRTLVVVEPTSTPPTAPVLTGDQADLSLAKTHTGAFPIGGAGSFTFEVANLGPHTAAGPIVITDTLPAGMTFVSENALDWNCAPTAASQVVTCTYTGSIASGASKTFSVVTSVSAAAPASPLLNLASVSSTTGDPDPDNNNAEDLVEVQPKQDVQVTITGSAASVAAPGTVSYTIKTKNNGALTTPTASNVYWVLKIPNKSVLDERNSSSPGTTSFATNCDAGTAGSARAAEDRSWPTEAYCYIGDLTATQEVTSTVEIDYLAGAPTPHLMIAEAAMDQIDSQPSNNLASVQTTLSSGGNPAPTVSIDPPAAADSSVLEHRTTGHTYTWTAHDESGVSSISTSCGTGGAKTADGVPSGGGLTAADPRTGTFTCVFDDGSASGPTTLLLVSAQDANGGSSPATETVTGGHVVPSVSITAPTEAAAQTQFTVSAAATDVSDADTLAGFTFSFDCGTGVFAAYGTSESATCGSGSAGTSKTVRVKAKDKDGAESTIATASVDTPAAPVTTTTTEAPTTTTTEATTTTTATTSTTTSTTSTTVPDTTSTATTTTEAPTTTTTEAPTTTTTAAPTTTTEAPSTTTTEAPTTTTTEAPTTTTTEAPTTTTTEAPTTTTTEAPTTTTTAAPTTTTTTAIVPITTTIPVPVITTTTGLPPITTTVAPSPTTTVAPTTTTVAPTTTVPRVTTTTAPPEAAPVIDRWAGENRTGTAVAVSRQMFDPGVGVVFIARNDIFPDALSGGPMAALQHGPVLLSSPTAIPEETAAELRRLRADRIVILGGTEAISAEVAGQLNGFTDGPVDRLPGRDRFETAALVSREQFARGARTVYVATGEQFADALSGGAAAAMTRGPVLLVRSSGIPYATAAELGRLNPTRVMVLGGPASVAESIAADIARLAGAKVSRVAGDTRYGTSASVSSSTFSEGADTVFIASGEDFPDALAATPAAGMMGAPLLLVQHGEIPNRVISELCRLQPRRIVLVGGASALSSALESVLGACLRDD